MNIMNPTCEYCGQLHHIPGCPNYEESEPKYKCSICGYGINIGDEYIVNANKEYAHLECVDHVKDLAKFLGYEIEEMKNE